MGTQPEDAKLEECVSQPGSSEQGPDGNLKPIINAMPHFKLKGEFHAS